MTDYCRKCTDRMVLSCESCDEKAIRKQTLDAFVAELEKECIDERGKGDDMDKMIYLGKIRETAKRMKGEV